MTQPTTDLSRVMLETTAARTPPVVLSANEASTAMVKADAYSESLAQLLTTDLHGSSAKKWFIATLDREDIKATMQVRNAWYFRAVDIWFRMAQQETKRHRFGAARDKLDTTYSCVLRASTVEWREKRHDGFSPHHHDVPLGPDAQWFRTILDERVEIAKISPAGRGDSDEQRKAIEYVVEAATDYSAHLRLRKFGPVFAYWKTVSTTLHKMLNRLKNSAHPVSITLQQNPPKLLIPDQVNLSIAAIRHLGRVSLRTSLDYSQAFVDRALCLHKESTLPDSPRALYSVLTRPAPRCQP
jgi:hypothetical protein